MRTSTLITTFALVLLPGILIPGCTEGTAPPPAAASLNGPAPAEDEAPAKVLIFVRTDCPVSNRYAPEVNRLHDRFSPAGVRFTLVYPNPDATAADIERHRREYGYEMPAQHDPDHHLVDQTGATITPEAAVYDRDGRLVYRGRIDDRFVEFGVTRPKPTVRDLEDVLEVLVREEEIELRITKAVGCFITDLQ